MNTIENNTTLNFTATHYKVDYGSWPLEWLVNYIEKKQRKVIAEQSNTILQKIIVINNLGESNDFELIKIKPLFIEILELLVARMQKEETGLFPFIREMMHAKECKCIVRKSVFHDIESTVAILNADRENQKQVWALNIQLMYNYASVSKTRWHLELFKALVKFQQELELHIYLQNKFLFPKIRAMKYELT